MENAWPTVHPASISFTTFRALFFASCTFLAPGIPRTKPLRLLCFFFFFEILIISTSGSTSTMVLLYPYDTCTQSLKDIANALFKPTGRIDLFRSIGHDGRSRLCLVSSANATIPPKKVENKFSVLDLWKFE